MLPVSSLAALGFSNAMLWMPPYLELQSPRSAYDVWFGSYSSPQVDMERLKTGWRATSDAYELKAHLPDVEPQSVTATLALEGTKIEVTGKRKLEGCTCTPTTINEIELPYRPRAEDIDIAIKDDVLSLRLARKATAKASTPLKVTVVSEAPKDQSDEAATQELRFVPHGSALTQAKSQTLEEKEKSLTDKFRSVALASSAVATLRRSATAATSGEEVLTGAETTTAQHQSPSDDASTNAGAATA